MTVFCNINNTLNRTLKLKIKNCTTCIQDRNNWKLYAEKPKHSETEVVAPKEEEDIRTLMNSLIVDTYKCTDIKIYTLSH
jgi:hypothetical protein